MKLDARRVAAFLADPGAVRVVLLHGEDEGTIRHCADRLTRAVAGGAAAQSAGGFLLPLLSGVTDGA